MKVSRGYYAQYIWKNKIHVPNHQPDIVCTASALQLYWIMWFKKWFMNVYDNYVDHYSL